MSRKSNCEGLLKTKIWKHTNYLCVDPVFFPGPWVSVKLCTLEKFVYGFCMTFIVCSNQKLTENYIKLGSFYKSKIWVKMQKSIADGKVEINVSNATNFN